MTAEEQRKAETFVIVVPLKDIEDQDVLAFLASRIQDHDHLREKLLTEPDKDKRAQKLEAMRPHLSFKAVSLETYMHAELARQCGVQPFYAEEEAVERGRIFMPESRIHEVSH